MGAGASVDDIDDLKKEYKKVADGLTADQRAKLESTFEEAEKKGKGEFFTIGKCRKEFATVVGDGDSPFAKPVGGTRTPAPAPEPVKVEQGPAPEGVERFALTELPAKLEAAEKAGLTPLILDKSPDHKVDTYFNYGKGAVVMDCKAMGLKVSMEKKPVDEVLETSRKQLIAIMKSGSRLVMSMQQGACDFVGQFNGDTTLPLGLFSKAGADYVTEKEGESEFGAGLKDVPATAALFREEDTAESAGIGVCKLGFTVCVTSWFSSEDIDEFLFKGTFGLPPREQFKVLELTL